MCVDVFTGNVGVCLSNPQCVPSHPLQLICYVKHQTNQMILLQFKMFGSFRMVVWRNAGTRGEIWLSQNCLYLFLAHHDNIVIIFNTVGSLFLHEVWTEHTQNLFQTCEIRLKHSNISLAF